jgi:hypothetical protein
MGKATMIPGARIVTLLGREGTLTAIEGVWLTVVFDDQPDRPQCYCAYDKWIHPLARKAVAK